MTDAQSVFDDTPKHNLKETLIICDSDTQRNFWDSASGLQLEVCTELALRASTQRL